MPHIVVGFWLPLTRRGPETVLFGGQRYVVSEDLPPSEKAKGFTAEIVDLTHPSDGGPVAIEWFDDKSLAVERAEFLNREGA